MQFGLQVNPYAAGPSGNPWDRVLDAARLVDQSQFDSLWLYDHFLYEGGYSGHPHPEPVMECFTTLGAVAAITERIRLGQLVLGVPYRNPAMMAKMATTVDLISHGRSILGLGAGWHQREYEAYGWGAFEDGPTRLRKLEEALRITLALWTDRPATFQGQHYRLDNVMELPDPIQRPHPPILVGGSGERVTLRLVAQYAQFCNVSGDPSRVKGLFEVLGDHCERVGRPYDEITRSIYTTVIVGITETEVAAKLERLADYIPRQGVLAGTPAQLLDTFGEYAHAGCQYVIFRTPDWHELECLRLFSEDVARPMATIA